MVRYEFRFNKPDFEYAGLRVQFVKDYDHVSEVETLANYPHKARRDWATTVFQHYADKSGGDNHTLSHLHFRSGYGLRVQSEFPNGATITVIKPNTKDRDIILIIQVRLFYFIFSLQK